MPALRRAHFFFFFAPPAAPGLPRNFTPSARSILPRTALSGITFPCSYSGVRATSCQCRRTGTQTQMHGDVLRQGAVARLRTVDDPGFYVQFLMEHTAPAHNGRAFRSKEPLLATPQRVSGPPHSPLFPTPLSHLSHSSPTRLAPAPACSLSYVCSTPLLSPRTWQSTQRTCASSFVVNPLACRACAIRFFSSKLTFSSARTQWNPSEIAARERDLLLVCLLMGGAGGERSVAPHV